MNFFSSLRSPLPSFLEIVIHEVVDTNGNENLARKYPNERAVVQAYVENEITQEQYEMLLSHSNVKAESIW